MKGWHPAQDTVARLPHGVTQPGMTGTLGPLGRRRQTSARAVRREVEIMTPRDVLQAPTLGATIRRAALVYADRPAQMRPVKDGFATVLYKDLIEDVWTFARAIHSLGLTRGDRMAIIGETCWEWSVTDWAAQTLGITTVPIYPTLPADQAQYILKDSEAKAAVCLGAKQADKAAPTGLPVLMMRPEGSRKSIEQAAAESTLARVQWEAMADEGSPEDIATIIYTSGTTGLPKGAMLPHRCFTTMNEGVFDSLPITKDDLFLSFLPMAHVFERYAGHVLPKSVGACVAYAGSLASLASDMVKVKPTIMLCVPRFLEATRGRIIENVKKQKPLNQKLFDMAISQGTTKNKGGFAPLAGLLDKLVGTKIRERTGGRIRFFVSGGAALNPVVSDFYIALGIPVMQGYGLTETCAASTINHPDDNKPWTVGPPIKGVEVKIAEDGEILIRGRSVMKGYFNLPEETAKAIDSDGWFHTGDIGEFEGKHLKITDRKKDLLVLANGKNIAPQAIENKLKESDYIAEAVLFGDGSAYCYALIGPDLAAIETWMKSQGESGGSTEQIIASPKVRALIKAEVDKVNSRLADFEKVKKHALLPKTLSVEDGELTPSMKVKRRVVKEKFADLLKPLQGDEG